MNGEDSGRGSSIGGGKVTSDDKSLKRSSPGKDGLNDGENNALPPADQKGSSGNSGGGDNDPPKKPIEKRKEDEAEEESREDDDDDTKCDKIDTTSLKETESNTCEESCSIKKEKNIENGHVIDSEEDEDVKPTLHELKSQGSQLNDGSIRSIRKARGRPRKYPIPTDASGNPIIKRPYKKRPPKNYKPTDIVRRKRKIKKENDGKPNINLARQKYLESLKNKESSPWDKEVADTLQNVIKIKRKSKKFKAIGRPRKRPMEEGEKMVKIRKKREKKVKLGMMAHPIVEIKKKSENDWDTVEAKYTVPGFCCNDCGAVYQSTAALRRHQNYECGKDPQFKCDECDYAAKHKGTLKSHIKNRHLPKSDPEDPQKKPRKPRKPRVLLIPRAPSPI